MVDVVEFEGVLFAFSFINVDELAGERGRLLAQNRRWRMLGWVLVRAAGAERMPVILVHSRRLNLLGSISWQLFVLFVTVSQLRSVLKQKEVIGETICMAISVYMLFGFTWARHVSTAPCTRKVSGASRNPAIRWRFSTFSRTLATSA